MGRSDQAGERHGYFELPPEAYTDDRPTLQINDRWLAGASPELQKQAMREWFHARYCDPSMNTPYMSSEGGFVFIHGGPYDPDEVIQERFHEFVQYPAMKALINELISEVGSDWAPRNWGDDDDYYDVFGVDVESAKQPRNLLETRLNQVSELLTVQGAPTAIALLEQLAFSNVISAFESYLWETMSYAVEKDARALEDIVTKHKAFSEQKILLGDIYKKFSGLKDTVKGFLQNVVWHRFDVVAPLLAHGLRIKPPSFKPFQDPVIKRHDIVHRSGFTKGGEPIALTSAEIVDLAAKVRAFANELEHALDMRDYEESGAAAAAKAARAPYDGDDDIMF